VFHARLAVIHCIIPLERALILDKVCHISELLIYNMCVWDTVYNLVIMNVLCVVWSVSFQTDREMTLLQLAWTSMAIKIQQNLQSHFLLGIRHKHASFLRNYFLSTSVCSSIYDFDVPGKWQTWKDSMSASNFVLNWAKFYRNFRNVESSVWRADSGKNTSLLWFADFKSSMSSVHSFIY
jgi:hypothetical protein